LLHGQAVALAALPFDKLRASRAGRGM